MVIVNQVKLELNEEQDKLFTKNLEIFKNCTNWWIDRIREEESTNLKILQDNYYKKSLELFEIKSNQTQLCMNKAIKMTRTSKIKRSEAFHLKQCQIYFNRIKYEGDMVWLTLGNRGEWIKFKGKEIIGKTKTSHAIKKNNEWFLYVSQEIEEPKEKRYKRCMGVDLGIAKIAVVSDWNGRNNRFFNGESYRFKKNHYKNLRKELQSKLDQVNVYKLLKRMSKKESNWVTNENHMISKEIVEMAVKNKRTIVLENLTGITKRVKTNKKTRSMLHGWSFRQLSEFIKYKAKMAGITVLEVDPRGTSKTCPKCKHYSRSNRKTQERFKCTSCGYESNADRVGAINIALRGTELLASR